MNTQNAVSFDYKRIPVENLNKVLAFLYNMDYEPDKYNWEEDAIVNDDKLIYNNTYLAWLWANGFVNVEERIWHDEDGTIHKYLWAIVDDRFDFDIDFFDDGGINIHDYYFSYRLDEIAHLLKEDGLGV